VNFSIASFLARRGLRESSLSTALMIIAVAVGVGFQVPGAANLVGYRAELLAQQLDSGFGDVRVRPRRGGVIREADSLVQRLGGLPGVVEVLPVVVAPGSIRGKGRAATLTVLGDDPRARHHPYRMVAGLPLQEGGDTLLLGAAVANRLGLGVGDQVELGVMLSTYPRLVLDDGGYGSYTMTIRGLVGFGGSESAFVTRSFLARELGDDTVASLLLVHARDHENAPAIAEAIGRTERGFDVSAWMDDSPYLRSSVRAVDTLTTASWSLGILAVGIPVLALLYISTLNRRRQIGLLVAMGFSRADLFVMFLLQGFILGAFGVTAGGVVSIAIVRHLMAHPIFDWQGFVVRPLLTPGALARTAGAILATSLVAGTYPAWRAARLDPSRILRGIE
jgi:ABC-type lipoprotein release transport system permease subunit